VGPIASGPAKGVVLVLGPGGAKSFAHAGVLKAFHDAKIPVAAIVATDIGAMIAAIHFSAPSFNAFEWEIQKIKPDLFETDEDQILRDDKSLNLFLKQSLGKKELGDQPYRLRICVSDEDNRAIAFIGKGPLTSAVRAALAGRGAIKAIVVAKGGPTARSCTASRPAPLAEARTVLLADAPPGSVPLEGPLVYVNVLPQKKFRDYSDDHTVREQEIEMERAIDLIQSEKNSADVLIEPELDGVSIADFSKKSEAAYRGKTATLQALPKISELLGIQEK
jgi:NTE family protein